MKDWQWFGQPGHFCAAHRCMFHLHTHVGRWCVSTVGEYRPSANHDEDFTEQPHDMGAFPGMKYETMVFELDGDGPDASPINHSELDVRRCRTQGEANKMHRQMCLKWSKIKEVAVALDGSES